MRLTLRDDLPFVSLTVVHPRVSVMVPSVLVDTGSASTLVSADVAADVGIVPEPGDRLHRLRGVGGHEVVFARRLDRLELGGRGLEAVDVEVGAMDYGFEMGGILGMDVLRALGAVLNLHDLTLTFG